MGAPTWQDMLETGNILAMSDLMSVATAAMQSQYASSPRMKILAGCFQCEADPSPQLDLIYDNLVNILTASGVSLDNWGRILAMPRTLDTDSGQITWEDEVYRFLLLYKATANISPSDAHTLNRLLQKLLGGKTYVIDNQNMTIRVVLEFWATEAQAAILGGYGLLTRGAGVGYDWYQIVPGEVFGFDGSGLQPFNQGVFDPFGPQDVIGPGTPPEVWDVWDCESVAETPGVYNTATGEWEIFTVAQYAKMKAVIGNSAYADATFRQMTNLSFGSCPWTPFNLPGGRTYDGNGFKVDRAGLVSSCMGVIQNLTNIGAVHNTGGIAYNFSGNSMIRPVIKNCRNTGRITVSGNHSAGGIVRECANTAQILGCKNSGNIYGAPNEIASGSISGVGGIAGTVAEANIWYYQVRISNCENSGSIIGSVSPQCGAGGIMGLMSFYAVNSDSFINNMRNTGTIYGAVGPTGGIAGNGGWNGSQARITLNAINTGDIYGASGATGGIAGQMNGRATSNACNAGNIFGGPGKTGGMVGETSRGNGLPNAVSACEIIEAAAATGSFYAPGNSGSSTQSNSFTTSAPNTFETAVGVLFLESVAARPPAACWVENGRVRYYPEGADTSGVTETRNADGSFTVSGMLGGNTITIGATV